MRILIAPDKFKGVQTSREVAENIAAGLRDVLGDVQIEIVPIADGGEGTAEVICEALGGEWRSCQVHDALGRVVEAKYAWVKGSGTAIIEMSAAAGIGRLAAGERDVDRASTFGVGEMILDAVSCGAREILVGLGGSATNDGGFGLARALGFQFFDKAGKTLSGRVTELETLAKIVGPAKGEVRWKNVRVVAAADVRNPLLGAGGATQTFGPQKGADRAQIEALERALTRLADVVARDLGVDVRHEAGTGAAGGLGFGLLAFCGATIRSGFDVVAEAIGLEARIKSADLVITGEGSLDRQTLDGKTPVEVAKMARTFGKRVFAIVGLLDERAPSRSLFDAVYAVAKAGATAGENIRCAPELLREGARRLARDL
jgi:glycerate kinase